MCDETFEQYLADVGLQWEQATLVQKEHAFHEYLNIECGGGFFTEQVEPKSIKISFDSLRVITIDTTETLQSIDAKLNSFLNEVLGVNMDFLEIAALVPRKITLALKYVPEEHLDRLSDQLDWPLVSEYKPFSEAFLEKHVSRIDWKTASHCQKLSEDFIRKHKDILSWKFVACDQDLSYDFMFEHAELIHWDTYIEHKPIADLDAFMARFKDHLHWWELCYHYALNEKQLEQYEEYIEWEALCSNPNFILPEELLVKYLDKLDLVEMDEHNPLSAEFKNQYAEHFN